MLDRSAEKIVCYDEGYYLIDVNAVLMNSVSQYVADGLHRGFEGVADNLLFIASAWHFQDVIVSGG